MTHRASLWIRLMLASASLLAWPLLPGCDKEHEDSITNPRDPGHGGLVVPELTDVAARVGNRSATLEWALADSSRAGEVDGYTIWLRRAAEGTFERVDSVAAPPAQLTGLENGQDYRAAVRPVLVSGLQGRLSREVSLTPALFSIAIEGGRERTPAARVELDLQAPQGSQGVRLGAQADLSQAPVIPFASTVTWELLPVDGSQTVFAQFVDGSGNVSEVVSDDILLDTRATILSLTLAPGGGLHQPGDLLQFRMETQETGGQAVIVFGQDGRTRRLRDDGAGGDETAGDGTYALDYVVEEDLRVVDALLTGRFTDMVGNQADAVVLPERLTVNPGPSPVALEAPTSPSPTSLRLTWSQALEGEAFDRYLVVRAAGPDVMSREEREVRTTISQRTQTEYTDGGLEPETTYYYVVQVRDAFGMTAVSNEVEGRPQPNAAPDPVALDEPTSVSERQVVLSWSRSTATDFASYRIVRAAADDPLEDPDRLVLDEITNPATTLYEDRRELEEGITFYYTVLVVDELGASAPSNVVSAAIPNLSPPPVVLQAPDEAGETSLLLDWSASAILDFAAYRLHRSTAAGVGEEDELAGHIQSPEVTQWLDTGLTENTSYYYRLFVEDKAGLRSGSNEISVRTANADPPAVDLLSISEDQEALTPTLDVEWSASAAHDFASYRIHRDTSNGVTLASPLAREIPEASVTALEDAGLQDNTRYAYRVFVYDDRDAWSGSNEMTVVTGNRPPDPVTLSVSSAGSGSITLAWTQSQAHDFRSYRLFRSTDSTNFTDLIGEWNQRGQTGHALAVAEGDSTVYFFRLSVTDRGAAGNPDQSTVSNVVSARGWGP